MPLDRSVATNLLKDLVPTLEKGDFQFGKRGFEKHKKKDQKGAQNVVPFFGAIFTVKLGRNGHF